MPEVAEVQDRNRGRVMAVPRFLLERFEVELAEWANGRNYLRSIFLRFT